MLVSHSKKFIYIKTNKTASTSIEMALQPWCQPDAKAKVEERTHAMEGPAGIVGQRLIRQEETTALDQKWFNHMPAAAIRDALSSEIWSEYRKVHAVRDPFDKALSSFFWKSSLKGLSFDTIAAARDAFGAYVAERSWQTDFEIVHVDGEYCGDLAVRYEHMGPDLAALADALDLGKEALTLPHTKQTARARMGHEVAAFFNEASRAIVLDRCSWIFDRFGYPETP